MLFDNFCKTEDLYINQPFFLFLSYIFSIDLINGLKIYYIDISILNAISQKKIFMAKDTRTSQILFQIWNKYRICTICSRNTQ